MMGRDERGEEARTMNGESRVSREKHFWGSNEFRSFGRSEFRWPYIFGCARQAKDDGCGVVAQHVGG